MVVVVGGWKKWNDRRSHSFPRNGFSRQLLKNWGAEGWEKHVEEVGQFYLHRRNLFFKAAEKHLTGLAEWGIPSAGMFGWSVLIPHSVHAPSGLSSNPSNPPSFCVD